MSNTELWIKIARDLERRNAAINAARRGDAVTGWSAGLALVGQVGSVNVAKDIAEYRDNRLGNGATAVGGTIQLSSGFASLFTTGAGSAALAARVGWVGVAGGGISLSGDLYKASQQLAKSGSIEAGTLWSLAGDLSGIVSGGGLTLIGIAVAAGAATVALPVIGTVSIANFGVNREFWGQVFHYKIS